MTVASVLKWPHDYKDFCPNEPTGEEWIIIGVWSAVGYQWCSLIYIKFYDKAAFINQEVWFSNCYYNV